MLLIACIEDGRRTLTRTSWTEAMSLPANGYLAKLPL